LKKSWRHQQRKEYEQLNLSIGLVQQQRQGNRGILHIRLPEIENCRRKPGGGNNGNKWSETDASKRRRHVPAKSVNFPDVPHFIAERSGGNLLKAD
jgi:hypothetical protein